MSGFDTSGVIPFPSGHVFAGRVLLSGVQWSDLNPFTQGYVGALLSDVDLVGRWLDSVDPYRAPAFSDLAPETLARIMEYCSAVEAPLPPRHRTPVQGRDCWRARQAGLMTAPPLTPCLGDDGKVYLRDVPSPSSDRGGS